MGVLLLLACHKKQEWRAATLHDYIGPDGCGWVIILEDGNKLEPNNLNYFNVSPEICKRVWVQNKEINPMSIFMVGKVVETAITD